MKYDPKIVYYLTGLGIHYIMNGDLEKGMFYLEEASKHNKLCGEQGNPIKLVSKL